MTDYTELKSRLRNGIDFDDSKEVAEVIESLERQIAELSKDAVPEGWVLVPTEILDAFPEINPSNYDHDDACALNAWGVELVLAVAPKQEK